MAEDKRANPYPYPTATEVEAAPGTREEKAARNVVTRYIKGIPSRGYLLGESDHAPIVKGVRDLTEACYALLDAAYAGEPVDIQINNLQAILETHGLPTETETNGDTAQPD